MSRISRQWQHLFGPAAIATCAIVVCASLFSVNVWADDSAEGENKAAPTAEEPTEAKPDDAPSEEAAEETAKTEEHSHEGDENHEADGEKHEAEGHEAGHDAHGGDDHGGGARSPIEWRTDLAIWSFIVFVLMLVILKKYAWGPLNSGLNSRESQIRNDIASAEDARVKAERMLAEHSAKLDQAQDEIREMIAEARRDAEHTKQEILAEAQRESEATKQRVSIEMDRARQAAEKELIDLASSLVANATEHVLNRSLTDDDQSRLIEEALSQLSS